MSYCNDDKEKQKQKLNEKAYRILLYKKNNNILDNDTTTEFLEEYQRENYVKFPKAYHNEPTNEKELVKELTDKSITYSMASSCGWGIKDNERGKAFREFENYARFNEPYIKKYYKTIFHTNEIPEEFVQPFSFISKNNRKYRRLSIRKSNRKSPHRSTRKSKRRSTKKSPRTSRGRSTRKR
jgi:hypothetical protein